MSKIRSWKFLAFLALFTALFAGCEEPTDNYAENSNGSSSSINGGSSSGGGSQNWTPPTRIKIKKIQLSAYSYWCDVGRWDNANGPDVYVYVSSTYNSSGKCIGKTNVVNNLSCSMLPYVFDNLNISTKSDYQNGTDVIRFIPQDKDDNGEETSMELFTFSPYKLAPKKYSDPYSYVLTFEDGVDKFKVWIEYY